MPRLLFLCILLISPTLYAETLLELYEQAVKNDPQLKIAEYEVLANQELKPQAQAALAPQLTLGGGVSENFSQSDFLSGDNQEFTNANYNLSLSYALYRRNLNIAVDQTDSVVARTEAAYESEKQGLMLRLAQAFFDILAADDNVSFARSTKDAFERQLDQAQKRFEVGLIAITDVQESQAGYDLAVADEIQALNQVDNAKEALREIIGSSDSDLNLSQTLSEEMELVSPDPENIDEWTTIALENSPQVLAAKHAIETSMQEIKKQRAANLPTVDLVAQHGYRDRLRGDDDPTGASQGTDNSIGIQVGYLLFEGGGIRARVREAQRRHTQALDQLTQAQRTVQRQTRNAYLNVLSSISRIKAAKQALTSTETALEAVQIGYEVGTRTSVDVLNARRDLLQAQRDYASSRYGYVLNTLGLKQAAGLIALDDFEKINQWLVKAEAADEVVEVEEESEG
ncbi:TolC family outer membrane protein [Candidatus Albibeggiatoa sp. nov. NOAA]|uniref:TolC family outer membrane protein n=1 Tax=Candidatus Albibeggiatoa sp. nov. NOAA TaxID=3162724 RepID=UPI0032F765D7|nr:TolC family outer membrane protein [Thiotrichaceae bacterium]